MLTFAIEKLVDVWPELVEIHHQHWLETEAARHGQPFAPSLARYMEYESIGWYVLYTARDESKLVGNIGVYYSLSMHTQQLIASEDTLFLLPEYRKGRNAINFIKFAIADAWKRGAVELMITSKGDRTGRLMTLLAFQPVAVQYSLQAVPTAPVHSLAVEGMSHANSPARSGSSG